MVFVPTGSRLILRTFDGRRVEALSLATEPVIGPNGLLLPVLAIPDAHDVETGTVELPTLEGVVRVTGKLRAEEGILELNVPATHSLRPVQRRAHARAGIDLAVSGTAATEPLPGGIRGWADGSSGPAAPRFRLTGHTLDVSHGGLRARVTLEPAAHRLSHYLRELYLELELAGPRPAGVVLRVVSLRSDVLRARFVYVSPEDRRQLEAYLIRRTSGTTP